MKALLIRHATTTGQAPDAPLAPEGYAQAKGLIPVLSKLSAGPLYSSPFRRALETLEPYADTIGQSITTLNGLHERTLSPTPLNDWEDHLKRSFQDPNYAPVGGESLNMLYERTQPAFSQIEAVGGPLPAFVTHGGITSALFNRIDPQFGFEKGRRLGNPALFEVTLEGGRLTSYEKLEIAP